MLKCYTGMENSVAKCESTAVFLLFTKIISVEKHEFCIFFNEFNIFVVPLSHKYNYKYVRYHSEIVYA